MKYDAGVAQASTLQDIKSASGVIGFTGKQAGAV